MKREIGGLAVKVPRTLDWVLVITITVVSLGLVWMSQSINTSLDFDSGVYLAVAQSALDGQGFTLPSGEPLTIFPVGYPALIAGLGMVGVPGVSAASVINVASFSLLIVGMFIYSSQTLRGRIYPLVATLILATSVASFRVYSQAWSESVFVVIVLAVLIILTHIVKTRSVSWPMLIGLGLLVSGASLLRFMGVLLVPVVLITILYALKTWRIDAKIVVLFLLSTLGFVINGVRNTYHNTPLFGERMDSALNLQGSVEQFVRQLGVYVIPPETTSLSFVLGGVLIAGLIASLWLIFVNRVNVLYPTSLMFVVIWSGVVWSQTTTRLDVNPERLGSPAFVAVIVLSLFVLDVLTRTINVQFSRRIHKQTNALGNLIAVFVVSLVVLSNFINSLRLIG